MLLYCIFYFC